MISKFSEICKKSNEANVLFSPSPTPIMHCQALRNVIASINQSYSGSKCVSFYVNKLNGPFMQPSNWILYILTQSTKV